MATSCVRGVEDARTPNGVEKVLMDGETLLGRCNAALVACFDRGSCCLRGLAFGVYAWSIPALWSVIYGEGNWEKRYMLRATATT